VAISGVSENQYREYLSGGGTLTFQLDADDIEPGAGFEQSPLLAPFLDTGFELKPSPVIESPPDAVQLLLHGDSWVRVLVHTYRRGGSIVYRRISPGRYSATVCAPQMASTTP